MSSRPMLQTPASGACRGECAQRELPHRAGTGCCVHHRSPVSSLLGQGSLKPDVGCVCTSKLKTVRE